MANIPMKSVVLDTSFLVALTIAERPNHNVAVQYFQYWIEHGINMFVPTIVYAEYKSHNASIPDYILKFVKVKPFNVEDADVAAAIQRKRVMVRDKDGSPKALFKDDIKIIGSACSLGALAIAHDDHATMSRYIEAAAAKVDEAKSLTSICLRDGFNCGIAELGEPDLGI